MMKISYLSSVLPCQCQGVNANHYIAEIGAFCTLKSVFSEPEQLESHVRFRKKAGAFFKNRTCDFEKRDMRFCGVAPEKNSV